MSLKSFDDFQWDDDNEVYVISHDYYVTLEDDIVTIVERNYAVGYGYSRGDTSMDSAKSSVTKWRKKALKTQKNKEVLSDTATDNTYSDGVTIYATDDDNVQYCISDLRWEISSDYYYAFDGYLYVG